MTLGVYPPLIVRLPGKRAAENAAEKMAKLFFTKMRDGRAEFSS